MMYEKDFIILTTNVVMSVVAITLQVATKDVLHRVVKERKNITMNTIYNPQIVGDKDQPI